MKYLPVNTHRLYGRRAPAVHRSTVVATRVIICAMSLSKIPWSAAMHGRRHDVCSLCARCVPDVCLCARCVLNVCPLCA